MLCEYLLAVYLCIIVPLILLVGADIKLKIFNENYAKLASVLPTEKSLTHHLVEEDIINPEEEKVLQTFEQTEAAAIILRKIHKSLELYSGEKFDALMSIMEQYGDTSCLDLINEMKQGILQSTTGKLVNYSLSSYVATYIILLW